MKKLFCKTLSVFFVLGLFIVGFSVSTYAVDLDYSGGSTSNQTGATNSTSGFSLTVIDPTYENVVGYRFSIVDSSGSLKSSSKAVNIYLDNTTYGEDAYSSAQRFITSGESVERLANKKMLANGKKIKSTTTAQSGREYLASEVGFYSIPNQNPSKISSWIQNTSNTRKNLTQVYAACSGGTYNSAGVEDYVLIEPIVRIQLAGVVTAATPTELAIYGASVSGGGQYDGSNGNLSNTGSETLWNLQYYINREFPNLLYVDEDIDVYDAVSIKTSGRYTYNNIVKKGYGCSVLKVSNVVSNTGSTYNIEYNANGGVGSMADTVVTYGTAQTIRNNAFTREGYIFNGWHIKRTSDNKWLYTLSDGSTEWYKKGSQPSGATLKVYNNGSKSKTASTVDGDTIVLYAQWTPHTLTVNYYSNYATSGTLQNSSLSVSASTNVKVLTGTFQYGTSYSNGLSDYTNTSYLNLLKTGHTATENWNTAANGSGKSVNQYTSFATGQALASALGVDLSTGNKTVNVYAQWKPKVVTVVFDKNDGSGSQASQNFTYGVSGNQFGYNTDGTYKWGNSGQFGQWDRPGYKLLGWATSPTATSSLYSIYCPVTNNWIDTHTSDDTGTGTVRLYAQWQNTPPGFVDKDGNWIDEGAVTIYVGNSFDPMEYVTALDREDGDITSRATVVANNVPVDSNGNTTSIGTYSVKYSVTDLAGESGTYTLTVNVIKRSEERLSLGVIRFISFNFLDTLTANSKWRLNPLYQILKELLAKDLSQSSTFEQVWEFSADDVEEKVRPWCLERDKGTQTNKDFLSEFKEKHRTKPED